MRKTICAAIVTAAALLGAPSAIAAPPVLSSASATGGHVAATWTLPPGVLARVVEVASSPETGSDGYFFKEHVVLFDLLDDAQTSYLSTERIPPGTYYVHVAGFDEECLPCAAREFTATVPITVVNSPPTVTLKNVQFTRSRIYATANVCDQEGGTIKLLLNERRLHKGKKAAGATVSKTVELLNECESMPIDWPVEGKLYKKKDVYAFTLFARDADGALSPPVTRSRRWR